MKRLLLLMVLLSGIWACKKQITTEKQEIPESNSAQQKKENKGITQSSPFIKELVTFANIKANDSSDIDKLFQVKIIDSTGKISPSNITEGIDLYKKAVTSQQQMTLPIFEITNSDQVILFAVGKGYMDAIWAKILINKNSQEISKIAFNHKAESEGYGAEITYDSFENKFTGTKISLTQNTFCLLQNGKNLIKGDKKIDGISGATITSHAVIQMLNERLKKYQSYLLD
ncbi:FMN-binding protein [Aquimarina rubra]|uniref:FMN-binding protein n=1 Tax=Aquimarina rubra TaxID=1920033 RepID=A0ABW5LB88_9FLAO